MHRGFLGGRRPTVEADVLGIRAGRVRSRALVFGHHTAGTPAADLVVQEFPVGVRRVPQAAVIVRARGRGATRCPTERKPTAGNSNNMSVSALFMRA